MLRFAGGLHRKLPDLLSNLPETIDNIMLKANTHLSIYKRVSMGYISGA